MVRHDAPRRSIFRWLLVLGAVAPVSTSVAATIAWDGGGDGTSWHDPMNWSGDALPGAADDVVIELPEMDITIVHSTGDDTVRSLQCRERLAMTGGGLAVETASSVAALDFSAGTIDGGGDLVVAGPFLWTGGAMGGAGTTVTEGGLTLRGAGTKDLRRNLNNAALADWTEGGRFDISAPAIFCNMPGAEFDIRNDVPVGWTDAPGVIDNRGTFRKSDGPGTTDVRVPMVSRGTVRVERGRFCLSGGDFTQTGGFTLVDAEFEIVNGVFDLRAGVVCGNGLVDADVINTAGTVAPGVATGTLVVEGRYVQSATGTLAIELGGTRRGDDYDVLTVIGDAELAGHLALPRVNDFEIEPGQAFAVLTTTGRLAGAFDDADCPALFDLEYAADQLTVHVTHAEPRGDLNCDTVVNLADLVRVLEAWGKCPDGCDEDLDDSGAVDVGDVLIVLMEWS